MSFSQADILYLRLVKAAGENKSQEVKHWLQRGADPNHGLVSRNRDVKRVSTPLQLACNNSKEKIVELLLKYKANPEVFNKNQPLGPLCLACVTGSTNIVRQILESGRCSVNFVNGLKKTAVYAACFYKDLNLMKILVEEYNADLNIGSELPLSACIMKLDEPHRGVSHAAVSYLLEHGAHVEGLVVSVDKVSTALHKAALMKDYESMKVLLKNHAKVNFKDHNGNSALHIFLLMTTAENYYAQNCIQLLIDYGAEIDEGNKYSETLLHIASAKGFSQTVQDLLSRGANPNTLCQEGLTLKATSFDNYKIGDIFSPLTLAVANNRSAIVQQLLGVKGQAYPVQHPETGEVVKTPLYFAVINDDYKMVKLLLDHGEDPNARFSKNKGSLLNLAVMLLDRSISYLLFVHGAKDFDTKQIKNIFTKIKCSKPLQDFEYGIKCKSYSVDESMRVAKLLVEFLTFAVHTEKVEDSENLMNVIEEMDCLKEHKDKCTEELGKMINEKFVKETSLYDLLKEDEKILVASLRNEINSIKLERNIQSKYRIFNIMLKIRCDAILRKAMIENSNF